MPVNTIQRVVEWSLRTFPNATPESTAHHMEKELQEIFLELNCNDTDAVAAEFADMVFLGLQGIARYGRDPESEILKKLVINEARTWGEPDEYGVVEHVRD